MEEEEEELNKLITGQSAVYGHCGSGRAGKRVGFAGSAGGPCRALERSFHHMSGSLHILPPCPGRAKSRSMAGLTMARKTL